MVRFLKSAGHGLLAAGALLIALYFLGAYVKGPQGFRDTFDPLNPSAYLPMLTLAPGLLLLWLGDQLATRRSRHEQI